MRKRSLYAIVVAAVVVAAAPAPAAAGEPIRIAFEKTCPFVGNTCTGDGVEAVQTGGWWSGPIAHIAFTESITRASGSVTADIVGIFSTVTGAVVMNGAVTEGGWGGTDLAGAQVHVSAQLIGVSESGLQIAGVMTVMPGSAG